MFVMQRLPRELDVFSFVGRGDPDLRTSLTRERCTRSESLRRRVRLPHASQRRLTDPSRSA
jgi:hypothetical protein